MSAPHLPADALNEATAEVVRRGIRILQGYRLAPTDAAHVSALLRYMAPDGDATIIDAGCGFGEVARLMAAERPDLDFILVNNNALQLSYAPPCFHHVLADMHDMPLRDGGVDGVMFLYSLCHTDFHTALAEAARVTKRGGLLFVFDYERLRGDNRHMTTRLCARALPFAEMRRIAMDAGWQPVMHDYPDGDDALFRSLFENATEYALIFNDLVPIIWKMRRA